MHGLAEPVNCVCSSINYCLLSICQQYLCKYNIITNRINNLLEIIMDNILEKDNDEIFKLLNCIYNICLISTEIVYYETVYYHSQCQHCDLTKSRIRKCDFMIIMRIYQENNNLFSFFSLVPLVSIGQWSPWIDLSRRHHCQTTVPRARLSNQVITTSCV